MCKGESSPTNQSRRKDPQLKLMPAPLEGTVTPAARTKAQMIVHILKRREMAVNPDYRRAFEPAGNYSIVVGRPYSDPSNKWKGYQQVKVDLTPGHGNSFHLEEFSEQFALQLEQL